MKAATLYSGIALLFLFVFSYLCGWLFKIYNDKFYKPFHFAGGCLTFFFFQSLIDNRYLSFVLVLITGILWEIYEWLLWKYLLKKKVFRPRKKDTANDLVNDLLGALTAFILHLL